MKEIKESETTSQKRGPLKLVVNISVGVIFSGLFVWLAARNVNWEQLKLELNHLGWRPLLSYLGLVSIAHIIRLTRWGVSLQPLTRVSWKRIYIVGAVGMCAIFTLPARLGEFVRPLMISEDGKISFGQATATVVVERIADGLCVSGMLFITVLLLDPSTVSDEYIIGGGIAAGVFGSLSVGLLIGGLLFRRLEGPLGRFFEFFESALEKFVGKRVLIGDRILSLLRGFFSALRLLSTPRVALVYSLSTVLIWGLTGLGIAILFPAFPAPLGDLGVLAGFACLSTIVIGIMIPSGPGTVGVFHAAVVFGLGMFAIGESQAFLFGTILHLLIAVINIGFGVLAFMTGEVSLSALWKRRSGDAPS